MTYQTREEWLEAAAEDILANHVDVFETHFGESGLEHLRNIKVSTGFPSRGGLTKVIGECWKSAAAGDEITHHIFINPRLIDIVEVVATLAHEMVHAADDGENGHRGPFLRCARALGLEGKATATYAGIEFSEYATGVEMRIGDYPHVGLTPLRVVKKQGTRMIKLEAPCCGYTARTTQKWLDIGYPFCPCGQEMEKA